jgi:hypothetical protein
MGSDLASHPEATRHRAQERRMTDLRVAKGEVREDQLTASIEQYTAKAPSTLYLALALGSMAVSVSLQIAGRKHESLFVGQWAAPFLLMGIYNKMVKQHGSDAARGSDRYTTAA